MHRVDISRLNKNRSTHLAIGFVIALSIVAMGFNYTVYDNFKSNYLPNEKLKEEELIQVQRTAFPKRQTPPPAMKTSEKIVEQEISVTEVP